MMRFLFAVLAVIAGLPAVAQQSKQCGPQGVWVEILGAGSGEITQDWSGPSYLVWIDDMARVLIDAGAGSTTQFARAGARFEDLDVIAISSFQPHLTSALPEYFAHSLSTDRNRVLPIFGPDGDASHPGTEASIDRMIGPEGVYPGFARLLNIRTLAGYKVTVSDVPTAGRRRWAGFRSENLQLSAIPVDHGDQPALAWRVDAGQIGLVFAGAFSHDKDALVNFARGADALIVTHAILESTRGELRDAYAPPSKIGEIAAAADVRTLILGHRTVRTRGRETQSAEAIEQHFKKSLIFANDLECWGF